MVKIDIWRAAQVLIENYGYQAWLMASQRDQKIREELESEWIFAGASYIGHPGTTSRLSAHESLRC